MSLSYKRKYYWALTSSIILALSLNSIGCNSNKNNTDSSTNDSNEIETREEFPPFEPDAAEVSPQDLELQETPPLETETEGTTLPVAGTPPVTAPHVLTRPKPAPEIFSAEEKIDLSFESHLAAVINKAAKLAVNSFPGFNLHPNYRAGNISETELLIRTDSNHLESIKRNGILNQHNTKGASSGGTLNPYIRMKTEMKFLHVDHTNLTQAEPPEFFPKYGFVNYKTTAGNAARQFYFNTGSGYGDVIFVLKPYVGKRTTYTMNDSLNIAKNPRTNHYLTPFSDLTDLLNFQHRGNSATWPYHRAYIEFQTWGFLSLHQVREVWIPSNFPLEKFKVVDEIADQYALKVYEMTDARGRLVNESFQANKKLLLDYSSKTILSHSKSYLDLDELEKHYPVAPAWEKKHIESAYSMTKDATVPISLQRQVRAARKIKNQGILRLEMEIPETFLSASKHAEIFVGLIYSESKERWLTQKDADDFENYLRNHTQVITEIIKLTGAHSFLRALDRIKTRNVNLRRYSTLFRISHS